VKKIFELEIPEIADGTIIIKNIVRDPGYRSKVAVYSPRAEVDPVGACVGLKGMRIQAVVGELEGEKVDIIKWDADIKRYIANAMNPVKINRIFITDEENREAIVVVAETQLAIAIGRQGQNIRLVSKLVGWRLDVITEEDFEKSEYAEYTRKAADELFNVEGAELETEVTSMEDIPGFDTGILDVLKKAGLIYIEDIIDKSVKELADIEGMDMDMAGKIMKLLSENVEVVKEEVIKTEGVELQSEGDTEVEYYECPNCGARIAEDMEKCKACGVELEFKDEEEQD
ncbi:MAG: KH domain-containing protein, partial [Spirochaetes bacterium]|nr:KH domain-containing protein [Spirochaetota bacterium]